jgi:hypothetical protein
MRVWGLSKVSIVVAAVLCVIGLIALAAWLGDLVAAPRLEALGQESEDYFLSFKQKGFRKALCMDEMQTGNAWYYYAPMVALIDSIDIDTRFVTDFLNGVSRENTRAASLVAQTDSVVSLLRAGALQTIAAAPLDYESGLGMELPNFMALRSAAQLLACRARLRLKTDAQGAAQDLTIGLLYAGDLAGGDLSLIGHMVGVVCLSICRRQIEGGLSQLSTVQLQEIARDVLALANQWPPLSRNLEAEHRMAAITLSEIGFLDEYEMVGLPELKWVPRAFFGWWLFHLLSWREGFSFTRTRLGAVESGLEMVSDLGQSEGHRWSRMKGKIEEWDSYADRSGNWLTRFSAPNLMGMYRRKYQAMARTKLMGSGALIEIFRRENGRWPDSLRQAELGGLEELLVDPITGEDFKYVVFDGDSACVYSIGTDLEDGGGVPAAETGDLAFVLHGPVGEE